MSDPTAIVMQPFGSQNAAFPNPDSAYLGRFHPGEDWSVPAAPAGSEVVAIGDGTVLVVGPIESDGQGGIVVISHAGSLGIPASTPGAPWAYAAKPVDHLLSVYAGIDPVPGLVAGACVMAGSPIGRTTAQCSDEVVAPCTDQPSALHLELRLGGTMDPSMHSADWSVAGPQGDSSEGYFFDPQVMVDDGLRDPSAFIGSLAAPCPRPSPGAAASPDPCPTPEAPASPVPTATSAPTAKPIADAVAALRAGIPDGIRRRCTRRTTGLVTGTIAAVDCHPDTGRIKLLSYYLLRPADARFVFSSRMRQYDLSSGADCRAGKPGIESRSTKLSIGCFVDGQGRANLRYTSRATCPAIYVGVLGTGSDVAKLAAAYEQVVGEPWRDPGTSPVACRSTGAAVSTPPAPTNVRLIVHYAKVTPKVLPPFRLEVRWDQAVDADTTIEVWGVMICPRKDVPGGQSCLTSKTKLPAKIRRLQASAPAAAGTVSWVVPGWELLGGAVVQDKDHKPLYGIVVRAVNAKGASRFVIAKGGNGFACSDCVY